MLWEPKLIKITQYKQIKLLNNSGNYCQTDKSDGVMTLKWKYILTLFGLIVSFHG